MREQLRKNGQFCRTILRSEDYTPAIFWCTSVFFQPKSKKCFEGSIISLFVSNHFSFYCSVMTCYFLLLILKTSRQNIFINLKQLNTPVIENYLQLLIRYVHRSGKSISSRKSKNQLVQEFGNQPNNQLYLNISSSIFLYPKLIYNQRYIV